MATYPKPACNEIDSHLVMSYLKGSRDSNRSAQGGHLVS